MHDGQPSSDYYIQEHIDESYDPSIWDLLVGNKATVAGDQSSVLGLYKDQNSIYKGEPRTLSQQFYVSKTRTTSSSLAPGSVPVPIVAPLANGKPAILPSQTIVKENGTICLRKMPRWKSKLSRSFPSNRRPDERRTHRLRTSGIAGSRNSTLEGICLMDYSRQDSAGADREIVATAS